jgi:hypothetical protein
MAIIKTLKSNIRSKAPWEVELGQYNLIVGDNGAGKSAIGVAAQLAVSDVADLSDKAEVKSPQVLFDLGDGETAYALASMSDGTDSNWGLRLGEKDTIKHLFEPSASIDADTAVPLRSVTALLRGDAAALRRQVLTWTAKATTDEDVLSRIPAHIADRYRAIAANQEGTPTDKLVAVAEYVRARKLTVESEAKTLDALVEGSGGLGDCPSEASIESATASAEQWAALERQAITWEGRAVGGVSREDAQAAVDAAQASLTEAEDALAQWRALLPAPVPVPAPVHQVDARVTHAGHALALLSTGGDVCPLCVSPVGAEHLRTLTLYYANIGPIPVPEVPATDPQVLAAVQAWKETVRARQLALASARGALRAGPHPGRPKSRPVGTRRTSRFLST